MSGLTLGNTVVSDVVTSSWSSPSRSLYQTSNGDFWLVETVSSTIQVRRSTDSGATWSTTYSSGTSGTAEDSAFDATNEIIYILTLDATSNLLVLKFVCSTQTFSTYASGGPAVSTLGGPYMGFRSSDGTLVITYQENTSVHIMGSFYMSIQYVTVSTSGVFSGSTFVTGSSDTVNYTLRNAIIGASSRYHIFYTATAPWTHRSLSSANVLDTASSLSSVNATNANWSVWYLNGQLIAGFNNPGKLVRATSQANPTFSIDSGRFDDANSAATALVGGVGYDSSSSSLVVFYASGNRGAYANADSGSGFGTSRALAVSSDWTGLPADAGRYTIYGENATTGLPWRLAQRYVPPADVTFNHITTGLYGAYGGTGRSMYCEIRLPTSTDGPPGGTLVATSNNISDDSISQNSWCDLTFPSSVTLTAGQQYDFIFRRTGTFGDGSFQQIGAGAYIGTDAGTDWPPFYYVTGAGWAEYSSGAARLVIAIPGGIVFSGARTVALSGGGIGAVGIADGDHGNGFGYRLAYYTWQAANSYAKTGTGISPFTGSGSKIVGPFIYTKTGAGVAPLTGGAAKQVTVSKTGKAVIDNATGHGAKQFTGAKTGVGVSDRTGHGADTSTLNRTGTGIAPLSGHGYESTGPGNIYEKIVKTQSQHAGKGVQGEIVFVDEWTPGSGTQWSMTAGDSHAVTLPSYQAGDLCFMHVHIRNTNSILFSATGWTTIDLTGPTLTRSVVLWRLMDGTEGTSVTLQTSGSGSGLVSARTVSYRGVYSVQPVGCITGFSSQRTGTISPNVGPTITDAHGQMAVWFIWEYDPFSDCKYNNTAPTRERYDEYQGGGIGGVDMCIAAEDTYAAGVHQSPTCHGSYSSYDANAQMEWIGINLRSANSIDVGAGNSYTFQKWGSGVSARSGSGFNNHQSKKGRGISVFTGGGNKGGSIIGETGSAASAFTGGGTNTVSKEYDKNAFVAPGAAVSYISINGTSASNTSSINVTLPTTQVGDLVVMVANMQSNSSPYGRGLSASGWTQLSDRGADTYSQTLMYRVMDGTEGSSVTFTVTGGNGVATAIGVLSLVYRGTDSANPIDVTGAQGGAATSNQSGFTTTALTTTRAGQVAVLAAMDRGNPGSVSYSPTGGSLRYWGGNGVLNEQIADNSITGAGTSVTFTVSHSLVSGPLIWEAFLLNPTLPHITGSGTDVFTLNRTGAGVAPFTGGGASQKIAGSTTYNETGSGVSVFTGSGADAFTDSDTGQAVSVFTGSGADSFTDSDTGTGVAPFTGGGTSFVAHSISKTGSGVSVFTGSGADAFTDADTGQAVSVFTGSGADSFTDTDTGTAISPFTGGGSQAFNKGDSGTAVSPFTGHGGDALTDVNTGSAVSVFTGGGGDALTDTDTGTAIAPFTGGGSESKLSVYAKTGTGIIGP